MNHESFTLSTLKLKLIVYACCGADLKLLINVINAMRYNSPFVCTLVVMHIMCIRINIV